MARRGPNGKLYPPRPRNPRRVVVDMIMEIRRITSTVHRRWDWRPGEDLYRNAEGRLGMWGHRERKDIPASEYRENDPAYWAELHGHMAELQVLAQAIQKLAREQYVKTGGGLSA